MFTAKTTQDFEITVNCAPDEFTWKKYFPETGRYMYKYPGVPEFVTDYEIFLSEPHTQKPDAPRKGQTWCILKPEWAINGIEDDFFDLRIGDLVEVSDVEEYEDGDWSAYVILDERMSRIDGHGVGDEVTFFTQEHVQIKAIAQYK